MKLLRHIRNGFLSWWIWDLFFVRLSFLSFIHSFIQSFVFSGFPATFCSGVRRLIGPGWDLSRFEASGSAVIWRTDAALCLCFWHMAWARLLGIFACIGHRRWTGGSGFLLYFLSCCYLFLDQRRILLAFWGPTYSPRLWVPDIGGEGYATVMICDRRVWWAR